MKKKLLSLLLVLIMVLGMFPMSAMAAGLPTIGGGGLPGIIIPPDEPIVPEDTDPTVYLFIGESYTLDLTALEIEFWEFAESYEVYINDEAPVPVVSGYYGFNAETAGDYTLEFYAYDPDGDELPNTHTVNIAVREKTVLEINGTPDAWNCNIQTIEMGLPDVKEVRDSDGDGVNDLVILKSDTEFPYSEANKVPLRVIIAEATETGNMFLEGIEINGESVGWDVSGDLWTVNYAPDWTETGEASLTFEINNDNGNNGTFSHTIRLKVDNPENLPPMLVGESTGSDTAMQYSAYTVDVADLFWDVDDTLLSYTVSLDGGVTYKSCGESYTVISKTTGEMTLMFKAADFLGVKSEAAYTLTLDVSEYEPEEGSFLIDKETESGRLLSLTVKDTEGNVINITEDNFKMTEGIIVENFGELFESVGSTIKVGLPASIDPEGEVVAHWHLVQNEAGLPFLSTEPWPENDTGDGVSTTLSNGSGSSTVYVFDENGMESGQSEWRYIVEYYTVRENNQAPVLKGMTSPATVTMNQYETYTVDLSTIFEEPEGDKLTYTVKVDDADAAATGASYHLKLNDDDEHAIVFTATDPMGASCTYTVDLTVNYVPRLVIETGEVGGTFGGVITKILIDGQEAEAFNYVKTDDTHRVIAVQLKETVADNAEVTINWVNNASDGVNLNPVNPIKLVNGEATVEIETTGNYFFKTKYYYTIHLSNKANSLPVLAENVLEEVEEARLVGTAYELDLSTVFTDADGDALTYTVSVDDAEAVAADASYSFPSSKTGTYKLVFRAKDAWGTSVASYTVNLTVKNSDTCIDVTVKVPDGITPTFYVADGFDENGQDILAEALTAVKGASADGWTSYVVAVPDNISRVSFRGTDGTNQWGGMSFAVSADMEPVVLRQVNAIINTKIDVENNTAPTAEQAVFKVKYGEDQYAVSGGSFNDQYGNLGYRFLLIAADNDLVYTHYAEPIGDLSGSYGTTVGNTKTVTTEASAPATAVLGLSLQRAFTVVVPNGATVVMYAQHGYYNYSEIPAVTSVPNGDGTKSVTFNNVSNLSVYRVSMPGEITKAGYVHSNTNEVVVNWDDDDRGPKYRADYDTSTLVGGRADDSMYVNVNYRNNLQMDVDETFRLRAYRIWQIINHDTDNIMIEPDFHYNIISGSDVIDIAPTDDIGGKAGQSWLDITAKKAGTAILEVTYDALDIVSDDGRRDQFIVSTNNFTFNAIEPARTALIVVQVGAAENDINFNFKLNRTNGWDVEFDTVYFVGDKGQIQLKPAVISGGEIAKVEVSGDKGATYTELTAGDDGYYTADIVSGNNIIRVTKTDDSEHYQLVRGDKIEYVITEVAGSSDQDGIIEAGETINVKFNGVHNATGKMSGIYNPNQYSTRFTVNGAEVMGSGGQYTYPSRANVEFRIPGNAANGAVYTLTDGKTLHGGWGEARGAHREVSGEVAPNLNASGASSLGLNLFPDITITVGGEVSAKVPVESVTLSTDAASVEVGKAVTLTATVAPANATDKTVTWSSSNTAVATVSSSGKVTGVSEGTATITATIGEYSDTCTVTVTEATGGNTPGGNPELEFGLSQDEILGYVTVSFVDKGVRKSEELNDPNATYPILPEFRNPLGTIIGATRVPFKAYDTIASVTLRLLKEKGFYANYQGDEYSSFYLAAIGDFTHRGTYYESFGEFDVGQDSGWMITWDDWFINKGASEFMVEDGDVVKWQYTCQLGTDIGDNDWLQNDGKTDKDEEETATTLTPSVSVNASGEAKAEVSSSAVAGALEQAAKDGASALEIAPEIKGEASKVEVELPADALNKVADSGLGLNVSTPVADVKLPNKAVSELAEGSGKLAVTASAAKDGSVTIDVSVGGKSAAEIDGGLKVSLPKVGEGQVMVIVGEDGTETIVTKHIAGEDAHQAILPGSATVKVIDNRKEFADTKGHWGENAINFVTERNLYQGVGNGLFDANGTMTRAMLVTVLYRLEGKPVNSEKNAFSDVADGQWYTDAIAWANANKIVTGVGGTYFDPNAEVTREQIASVMYRYAKYLDMSTHQKGDLSQYEDDHATSDWAKDAKSWAVGAGLISGKPGNILDPGGDASRTEVASILQRLVKLMVK